MHNAMPVTAWRQLILLAALCVSVGAFLVNQIYDLDIWWQVAIGRDILAHAAVPSVDRFAAAGFGRPYHDSHWLFQVLVAGADRLGGMAGVQLVMVALWSAIFACIWRASRCWVTRTCWVPLLFIAAMASSERFLPRPELITYLGVAFFYWRLQEDRYRGWNDLVFLLIVQTAWANAHGLFVLGPFLIGCYWLAALFGRGEPGRTLLPALSRLLILDLAATLLTPYGVEGWRYALLLFREAGPQAPKLLKSVGELSPTFGVAAMSGVAFWFFLVLLVFSVSLAGWTLLQRKSISFARLLIVSSLLAAALSGRRNMVLFALVAAPFVSELLSDLIADRRWAERWGVPIAALAMLVWSWFPLSGYYYLKMELPTRTGFGATPSFFPHGFPAFLERAGFQGQVFNSNTLGGFYLYHNHPRQLPFTDGRWEVYDAGVFEEIGRSMGSSVAWQRFAERYEVTGILLQHASSEAASLLPLLHNNPYWRLVYLDAAASFWVGAETCRPVPTLLPEIVAPPSVLRLDDCLILDRFYQLAEMPVSRARNLERALAFGQATEGLLASLGATLLKMERYSEAQEVFERLLREFPRNITALNELAFLAYRRGDLPRAEQLLRRVIELNPENTDARANLERVRRLPPLGPAGKGA